MNVISATPRSLPTAEKVALAAPQVNLYNDVPMKELSLDEFEVYALKRLKVRTCCRSEYPFFSGVLA